MTWVGRELGVTERKVVPCIRSQGDDDRVKAHDVGHELELAFIWLGLCRERVAFEIKARQQVIGKGFPIDLGIGSDVRRESAQRTWSRSGLLRA